MYEVHYGLVRKTILVARCSKKSQATEEKVTGHRENNEKSQVTEEIMKSHRS